MDYHFCCLFTLFFFFVHTRLLTICLAAYQKHESSFSLFLLHLDVPVLCGAWLPSVSIVTSSFVIEWYIPDCITNGPFHSLSWGSGLSVSLWTFQTLSDGVDTVSTSVYSCARTILRTVTVIHSSSSVSALVCPSVLASSVT